jgi:hypothetical protein
MNELLLLALAIVLLFAVKYNKKNLTIAILIAEIVITLMDLIVY